MMRATPNEAPSDLLLRMRDVRIEGRTNGIWQPIVKGVDLDLRRGEILGLIGESGAGKSTLGLAAMGFTKGACRISGGTISFDGIDLVNASQKQLRSLRGRRIAYVAQSAAAGFNPAHTIVSQFIEVPVRHKVGARAEAFEDAVDLYRKMGLPFPETVGFRYPHQISGGQLQRAMTAMAMACRPDLIVFDEPTTALDVTTQVEVLASIRDIVARFGTAAIYITHDLAVVAQMADRIKVLRHGLEVEDLPTSEMIAAPHEAYTKSLWAVRNLTVTADRGRATPETTIDIRNVSVSYGKFNALRAVSLCVQKGRTVALVGESGSGKTTVARTIVGLQRPNSGEILFGGKPLAPHFSGRSRDLLRRIQLVYQSPDAALNPRQTVHQLLARPLNLYFGLRGRDLLARIRELLDIVGLDPDQYLERLPRGLSGGQKQRICIARALAANPEVIVCDEVTSALDQLVAEEVLRLLRRLQDTLGVSIVFITHDLATVRAIADEVVVLRDGVVVEAAGKNQLFAAPKDAYTQKLLSSVPAMDPTWLDSVLEERIPSAAAKKPGESPAEAGRRSA